MAKGKHAAALFEVICTGKKPPKSSLTGRISTPSWWFSGRKKPADRRALSMAEREPAVDEPSPNVESPAMRIAGEMPVELDKGSREIKFRLSYAGAAAAAFVLIVVMTIAYMVGTRAPAVGVNEFKPANIALDEEKEPQASPLMAAVASAATVGDDVPTITPHVEKAPAAAASGASGVGATAVDPAARQVGLNYVVFQSYPDPAIAQKAMDFLNKNGFACSVVKLPGSSWSSVVSMKGFDHIQRNPELEDYKAKATELSEKFAGKRAFNRFEPLLFKWRPDQSN